MATTDSVHRIIHARAFRHARCYAPDLVMTVLREVVAAPQLALLVDVDTLERSALAKIDRVMLLALDALARTSVQVVLVALYERERAALLQRSIAGSWCLTPGVGSTVAHVRRRIPAIPLIAISDEPDLLGALTSDDRGIALGRPELVRSNVAVTGDTAVRATLWWLLEERVRSTSS